MTEPMIRIAWPGREPAESDARLAREWLLTNGLGGYASGTLLGIITRRYHGYLVAALPAPFGRVMMFNDLVEHVELPNGKRYQLGGEERAGVPLKLESSEYLSEFRLEAGLPVWRYELDGAVIEKRLVMPHIQNSVYVNYRLLSGVETARLMVRPSVHFRPHEEAVNTELDTGYVLMVHEDRYEIALGDKLPALRFLLYGSRAQLTVDKLRIQEIVYRIEERRGYPARGDLWSAGYFNAELRPDADATLVASTDSWECMSALAPVDSLAAEKERRRRLVQHQSSDNGTVSQLLLAADQFLVAPVGRVADAARAHAEGDEIRTVIAGYHWFTDWGRDTMISLEGLTLTTGRHLEARWILRTFASAVRDGLIPNLFPEGQTEGLYHTADATLWFFHAIQRYVELTGDRTRMLRLLLPKLRGHRRAPHARHAFRHRRGPCRRAAAAGRARLSAHLDGRQGGRLGGDAAARQGGRDQRPLVQRPAPAGTVAARRSRRGGRAAHPGSRRARPRIVQPPLLVCRKAATCTTWSMANRATIPLAAPIRSWRFHWSIRCSNSLAGSRCWTWSPIACSRRWGLRSLAPGASGLQSRNTMAICARATPPIIRAPCGRG
jgi:hypothetical protein